MLKKVLSVALSSALIFTPMCCVHGVGEWEKLPPAQRASIVDKISARSGYTNITLMGVCKNVAYFSAKIDTEGRAEKRNAVIAYILGDETSVLHSPGLMCFQDIPFALTQIYIHLIYSSLSEASVKTDLPAKFSRIDEKIYESPLCQFQNVDMRNESAVNSVADELLKHTGIETNFSNVLGRGMTSTVVEGTLRDDALGDSAKAIKILTTKNCESSKEEVSGCTLVNDRVNKSNKDNVLPSEPVIIPRDGDKYSVVVVMPRANGDLFDAVCKPTHDKRLHHNSLAPYFRGFARGLNNMNSSGIFNPDVKPRNVAVKPKTSDLSASQIPSVADHGGTNLAMSADPNDDLSDPSEDWFASCKSARTVRARTLAQIRSPESDDSTEELKRLIKDPEQWNIWKEKFIHAAKFAFEGTATYTAPEVKAASENIRDCAAIEGEVDPSDKCAVLGWITDVINNKIGNTELEFPDGQIYLSMLHNLAQIGRSANAYSLGVSMLEAAAKQSGTVVCAYNRDTLERIKSNVAAKNPEGELSEEDNLFFNLVSKLLDENIGTRMTLSDALEHPYFQLYKSGK